jgi:SAM-dependent methyltransferase
MGNSAGFINDCFASFEAWESGRSEHLHARWRLNALLPSCLGDRGWAGYCNQCARPVDFLVPSAGTGAPDLREELFCSSCGLSARVRGGLTLATRGMDTGTRVYITEQASKAFVWLQSQPGEVVGSEFAPDHKTRRRLADHLHKLGGQGDIRFEDVTALGFDDASVDTIISFDVLEHVPDYRASLREFARVLKPGGTLVVTVPFRPDIPQTLVRARITDDGQVEHLLDPEYHGDPLGHGVLCFYHFGWDVLEETRTSGFSSAQMAMPWAPSMGMFCGLWTLVARR